MLLKNRKDAAAAGESKFYTGRPCINGHYAFRYTASGTCAECINGPSKAKKATSGNPELIAKYQKRDEILSEFIEIKEPVHRFEIENAQTIALGLAILRSEVLTIRDVWLSPRPSEGVLYRIRCHKDDADALRSVLRDMYKPYAPYRGIS